MRLWAFALAAMLAGCAQPGHPETTAPPGPGPTTSTTASATTPLTPSTSPTSPPAPPAPPPARPNPCENPAADYVLGTVLVHVTVSSNTPPGTPPGIGAHLNVTIREGLADGDPTGPALDERRTDEDGCVGFVMPKAGKYRFDLPQQSVCDYWGRQQVDWNGTGMPQLELHAGMPCA